MQVTTHSLTVDGEISSSKFIVVPAALSTSFLKANGDVDNTTNADLIALNTKTQNQSGTYRTTTFSGTLHTGKLANVQTIYSETGRDLVIGLVGNNLSLSASNGVVMNKAVTSDLDTTTGALSIGGSGPLWVQPNGYGGADRGRSPEFESRVTRN